MTERFKWSLTRGQSLKRLCFIVGLFIMVSGAGGDLWSAYGQFIPNPDDPYQPPPSSGEPRWPGSAPTCSPGAKTAECRYEAKVEAKSGECVEDDGKWYRPGLDPSCTCTASGKPVQCQPSSSPNRQCCPKGTTGDCPSFPDDSLYGSFSDKDFNDHKKWFSSAEECNTFAAENLKCPKVDGKVFEAWCRGQVATTLRNADPKPTTCCDKKCVPDPQNPKDQICCATDKDGKPTDDCNIIR